MPSLIAVAPVETPTLRPASAADIPALVRLENRAFATDRLTRRSFGHLLARGRAALIVAELPALSEQGDLAGYALVLFRRGTSLARLYSLAVDPAARGRGVGAALLAAAEKAALDGGVVALRLEVRSDNAAAIALYRIAGYRGIGRYLDYYEDHEDALRFEKRLVPTGAPPCRVPYYAQTTEFTCGPAALMMAMAALDPENAPMDDMAELRLWREATTVFTTSGHGGCEAFGLALAAHRRGFRVTVLLSSDDYAFLDGVRSAEKKRVMRLVQEDFRAQAAATDIAVAHGPVTLDALTAAIDRGAVVLVLISHWRMYAEKVPHWVVVHGHDARFVYVHDPFVDPNEFDTAHAKAHLPIPHWEFERMARYGRARLSAAVVIERRAAP